MVEKSTICKAAMEVLTQKGGPMGAKEIYDRIVSSNLYIFKAENPLSVLKSELRKHSQGVDVAIKSRVLYFQLLSDGTYWLKDKPLP